MNGNVEHDNNDCDCRITHYIQNNIEIRSGYITARDARGETVQTLKMQLNSAFLNQFLADYLIR